MSLENLLLEVQKYHPNPKLELIEKAYNYAEKAHAGQLRATGEPYFIHLVETAYIACQMRLDLPSIAAALLHDTIEDCGVTYSDIQKEFGTDIAHIVEGVSKLTRMEFISKEEAQIESFRKLLLAMAQDIRVVLIKLCDRLHNMRTLEFVKVSSQIKKATETKEIYAPLANRLGIHWLKSELEDLCLKYLRPELFKQLTEQFNETKEQRDLFIKKTTTEITKTLEEVGLSCAVKGRAKHFYSIWQKMEKDSISFQEIHDVLGFRIIVPTLRACYEALGVVHATWKPIPGRFKDYIAMPKPNMYQSLHTTLIGPEGRRIEVQIRTPEMNRIAEEGVAAHWRYKEGESPQDNQKGFDLQWVKELVETQEYLKNPEEFIQSVKSELFPDEVFIFTPKGDLIHLPYGSCPVDFAYAVHTDLGNTVTGAKINGSIVPLNYILQNGDTIEIINSKNQHPNKDWLQFVKSSKAKQRIRAFVRTAEQARSIAAGMELFNKELKKYTPSFKKIEKSGKILEVSKELGFKSVTNMYADIGYGKVPINRILAKLIPEEYERVTETQKKQEESQLQKVLKRASKASKSSRGVTVNGIEHMIVRFAKCCEPLAGDPIVGFVTRGRGVTIHHSACSQALSTDIQRRIPVSWNKDIQSARRVKIIVISTDTKGLLAKLSKAVSDSGGDIRSATSRINETNKAIIAFEVELHNADEYQKTVRALEMVAGVIKVERVTGWDGE